MGIKYALLFLTVAIILVLTSGSHLAVGQINPCPPGKVPALDPITGNIIIDPKTHMPECNQVGANSP